MKNFIYVKKCLGKDLKPLDVYKVRTMYLGANKISEQFMGKFDSLGHPIQDSRIIPFGKFLRKYWFDELPQIYNLIKGDMKLVGIRPNNVDGWNKYPISLMEKALRQKPGLMGVQYAYPKTDNFQEHISNLEDYLVKYENNNLDTDKEYFEKIVSNIVLNGIRSS